MKNNKADLTRRPPFSSDLIGDIRKLIESVRQSVAATVNAWFGHFFIGKLELVSD